MPRNGSGTFTLAQPPFVPQTPISSSAVNSDLSDIASALTGSLARDGQGGMTAELPLANAGFSYASDPNTGMHRTGADAQAIECGGVDIIDVTTSGATVHGSLEVTGPITSGGVAILPIGLGPLPWSGLTAPPKWVLCYGQSLPRAAYPDLWTFASGEIAGGNTLFTNGDGSTTFTVPDLRGRLPAGKDNMGGVAANRLTAATMVPNGNTLGAASTAAETRALATTHLPPYTPAGSISGTATNSATLLFNGGVAQFIQTSGAGSGGFGWGSAPSVGALSYTVSGSLVGTAQGGASTPFAIVQPTIITNYIIYAGA